MFLPGSHTPHTMVALHRGGQGPLLTEILHKCPCWGGRQPHRPSEWGQDILGSPFQLPLQLPAESRAGWAHDDVAFREADLQIRGQATQYSYKPASFVESQRGSLAPSAGMGVGIQHSAVVVNTSAAQEKHQWGQKYRQAAVQLSTK